MSLRDRSADGCTARLVIVLRVLKLALAALVSALTALRLIGAL